MNAPLSRLRIKGPDMAKEALELWQGLPADTRRMLLSNVWCGECRKAVTIVDYHAELKGVVVLQGFCGTCGHKVARVIDDLAPAPQRTKQGNKKNSRKKSR